MYLYHYLPAQSSRLYINETLSNDLERSYEYVLHLSFVVVLYGILWIIEVYILGFQI